MKLPFKITADSPSDTPQVGDTNFLDHYTGANTSMAWAELLPGVRQAIEKYILPYLGLEMYTVLVDYFDAPSSTTAEKDRALLLLQDAAAYFTAYHVLPERNAFLASMGVVQNVPIGGAQPASQWSYKALRWNALENGDRFLDLLIAHLEAMVAASNTWVNPWKSSAAYKTTGSAYFRQTDEMDAHLNMQGSRRSFLSLIKYFREVEEDVILPILCDALTTEIKGQMAANNLSPANTTLLRYVRKAVANLGLAAAVPHHRIVLDGDGFRVVSQTDQFDDRRNQTNSVHDGAISSLQETAQRKGDKALSDLQTFLAQNPDTYPLWRDSPCRPKPRNKAHGMVASPNRRGGVGLF